MVFNENRNERLKNFIKAIFEKISRAILAVKQGPAECAGSKKHGHAKSWRAYNDCVYFYNAIITLIASWEIQHSHVIASMV
jgi:hypothetical protein